MLTIEGVYKDGQIVLNEQPKLLTETKVVVVFEENLTEKQYAPTKRPFGLAKGKFTLSDDFDEPLEDLKDYM